jgi:anti-anti-sigma factor
MKMKFEIKETKAKDGSLLLKLNGEFTIYSVKSAKEMIAESIKNSAIISVDLSGILKMDTAGYQLLLYFYRESSLNNKKFSVTGKSPESERMFSLYGILN